MNKELYIKRLEDQNEKLRQELKWKLEVQEYKNILEMVFANFIQVSPAHVLERIEKSVKDYPFNPHPINDQQKKNAKNLQTTIDKKMRGEFEDLINELKKRYKK
jgi:hypothetical protein